MQCTRCQAEQPGPTGWCADCEHAYDGWVRRYAADILGPLLAGTTIITIAGMLLPILGLGWLIATTGVFGGFGALIGLQRLNRRRRRRQFLRAPLPRAYLTSKP